MHRMEHTVALSVLLALVLGSSGARDWDNTLDHPLLKECPSGEAFYELESYHSDLREDRQWYFGCRICSALLGGQTVSWHYNQNDWDSKLDFRCSEKSFVCGVNSFHDNYREDRIWSYKCCKPKNPQNCQSGADVKTGYINNLDGYLSWQTPSASQFITGFYSYHNNNNEDRRWKVYYGEETCVDPCACSGSYDSNWSVATIDYDLDHFTMVPSGTVTLVSKNIDNNSSAITAKVSVVVSTILQKTSTFSNTAGVSISLMQKFSVGVPFVRSETSLTVGASYEHTWGRETTISEEIQNIFEVTAPPNTHAVAKAVITKSTITDVPFTMTLLHKTLGCECSVKGTWSGADYHDLRLTITDKNGVAMDLQIQELARPEEEK